MSLNTVPIPHKREIKEIYESYNSVMTEIMGKIEEKLKHTIKLSSMPTYKSRIKSFESYYRKVLRLKADEVADRGKLISLTDMMGIRIICAFLEDLSGVLKQVKENFTVKEVEYKGSGNNFREFGYESVHVLIAVPEDCFPDSINVELPADLVCEIQIRTILQDAWAEVEHELIYKTEFSPFDMPLRRKLASINASLSLADTIFQEIRDYQNKLQMETMARRESFYSKVDEAANSFESSEYKALKEKNDVSRISPFVMGTIDDMLLDAIHSHNSGDLDRAVKIYTKILEANPAPPEPVLAVVRKHRGMAYFANSDYDLALEDFKCSYEYDKNGFRALYYMGIVYSVKGKFDEAIKYFSLSLEINEFQSHAHYRRAIAYYNTGEYSSALSDLSDAEAMGLDDDECRALRKNVLKKLDMDM